MKVLFTYGTDEIDLSLNVKSSYKFNNYTVLIVTKSMTDLLCLLWIASLFVLNFSLVIPDQLVLP